MQSDAGVTTAPHFADRLTAASRRKAPVCVGLDPVYARLPPALGADACESGAKARMAAITAFCEGVIDAVAPHVACIKIQSACFERYQAIGMQAVGPLVQRARKVGLVVILDAKRGDIGISSQHYAEASLAPSPFEEAGNGGGADALTVNPYLGDDALEPFIRTASEHGRGLFALVRTSNPGSDALQSLALADGRAVCDAVADMVRELGEGAGLVGTTGYSLLGAVVGATKAADMRRLRALMPRQIFLVPGFGAQGGTARDVADCFGDDGGGALITASRSVLYAFEAEGGTDWKAAVEAGAASMATEVTAALNP
jgi:orotidine-5'-phosphate decarboxylase